MGFLNKFYVSLIVLGLSAYIQSKAVFAKWESSSSSKRINLGMGVAFPSNNTAIASDPAFLGNISDGTVDAFFATSGQFPPFFEASASKGFNVIGFGAALGRQADTFLIDAGIGASAGGFSFGVGTSFQTSYFYPSLSGAIRYETTQGPVFALVLPTILSQPGNFVFGFGIPFLQMFRFELDVLPVFSFYTFSFTNVSVSPAIWFSPSPIVEIMAKNSISILPEWGLNSWIPHLELCVWPWQSFGFRLGYNTPQGLWLFGIKSVF